MVIPANILEMQSGMGPLSLTPTLAVRTPLSMSPGQRLIGYITDLTLSVHKPHGCHIAVAADIAGTLHTLEFGYAPAGSEPETVEHVERMFSVQGLQAAVARLLEANGPVPDDELSFLVTTQHEHMLDEGRTTIDAVDFIAILQYE